jgi:hypothetical protein
VHSKSCEVMVSKEVAQMDQRPSAPFPHELEAIRLCVETGKVGIVNDELREIVDRYLPDLKDRLPLPSRTEGSSLLD